MSIGEKIKKLRKSLGLSQQQLGGSEFTKGHISQIEKGYVNPSLKVLTIISERLKTPISYFLDEENVNSKEIQKKFIIGENLYLQKKYELAGEIFKDIVSINCDTKNSFYCISLLYLGKCLFFLNNYIKSIEILKEALNYLNEISLYEEIVNCYKYLGDCNFNLNDFEQAISNYNKGLDLIHGKMLNVPNTKAKLLLNIASAYSNIGNFKVAIEYFNKDILHCQKSYNADTLLDCYVRMGYCYYKLDMYKTSKQYISKAVAINRALNSDMVNTEIYSILGITVAKEGKLEIGFNLLSKSMDTSLSINYEFGYNMNITYWVEALICANRIDEAEDFALKHLNNLKSAENKEPLYLLQGHIGIIYMKKDNIEKGSEYLKAAIKNYIDTNLYWEVHYYSRILADMIININPNEAKDFYNLSIDYIAKGSIHRFV